MINLRKCAGLFVLLLLFSVAVSPVAAQETTCVYKKKISDNAHDVEINSGSHIAVPRKDFLEYIKMEEDLKAAQARIVEQNGIIESLEVIREQQKKEIEQLKAIVAKAEEAAEKWQKAAEKCEDALKRCLGSSRISLELGAGMTGDSHAAGLIGLGYQRVRAWGLLGESGEKGWFVGYEVKRW